MSGYDSVSKPQQTNYGGANQAISPLGYQSGVPSPGGQYQPYAQQSVLVGVPIYPDCSDEGLKSKFINQGYKDLWCGIAFLVQILVTVVWGFVNLGKYKEDFSGNTEEVDGNFSAKLAKFLPLAGALALAVAFVMLALMRLVPRLFIVLANVCIIAVNVGAGFYGFAKFGVPAGLPFIVLGLFHLLFLFVVRRRIPLAGALLANSVGVVTKHYGAIVVSFASLIVLIVHCCFFSLMVVPTMQDIQNKNLQLNFNFTNATYDNPYATQRVMTGGQFGLVCLFMLMFFWTTQVIVNVVHVTSSGTVATWYFAGPNAMPHNPSIASLKRALTTSFGSICLGSLIVAFLKLLHALARAAARNQRNFLACLCLCFVTWLERLMEYFNVYAFTHVAIYGSSFVEAAKQTWEMIKNCGVTAIIDDNLVFPVIHLVTFIDSLAIGVGLGFAASSWLVGILSFLISFVIHALIFRVVYSGIVTLFVCYAENPQILASSNPQFNQEMMDGVEALKLPIC